MKNYRRTLALVLTVILAVCLFALPVMAATETGGGLELTLTTDKAEYTLEENIAVSLTVKNTTESAIGSLVAEHVVPNGFSVVSGTSQKSIETLDAGESVTVDVVYTASNPNTGDYTVAAVAAIMVVAAAGLIALGAVDAKARKSIVSMFLCCIMVAGLAVGVSADELTDGVTVSTTVKVNGDEITLSAKVSQTEEHTKEFTTASGEALTLSNLLPETFAGSNAVKAVTTENVHSFAVTEPGTYSLCLVLSVSEAANATDKVVLDSGKANEAAFEMEYAVTADELSTIVSNSGYTYLTGYSVDLSAGTHTLIGSDISAVYVLAKDTDATYVAKYGDTWYPSVINAMKAANTATEDAVVTMYADNSNLYSIEMSGTNNVVLNGNGHTITTYITDAQSNHLFVLKKTEGEITIRNLFIEHDAQKHVFRIDTPAVVNLVDVEINADGTSTTKDGLIYLHNSSDINLNLTRVKANMAISTDPNYDNDARGCKSGIITTTEAKSKDAQLNISLVDCYFDATKSGTTYGYAGICIRYGNTANITLENTTILTGNEYAIRSRKHLSEDAVGRINLTLVGECVLKSTNADLNNADGYSYGGNGIDSITITVK